MKARLAILVAVLMLALAALACNDTTYQPKDNGGVLMFSVPTLPVPTPAGVWVPCEAWEPWCSEGLKWQSY